MNLRALAVAPPDDTATTDAPLPHLGPNGELSYRGRRVCLSERNALLVGALLYHYERGLTNLELLARIWPDGATHWMLDRSLRQLDRRLARIGLAVVAEQERHALRPASHVELRTG